jgi:hypothetical protein
VWAVRLVCVWGVFNTPLAVGGPTLVMRLAPDQRSSSYLAAFNAIIGVVMAAAAVLGGQLAAHAGGAFALAGASLGGLQLVFLLSFVGRAGSLWLLHRVREPSELPLGELVRKAMSVRVGPRPAADRKPPAASATAGVELSPLDSAA